MGVIALSVVLLFCLIGIYAPLLASSKPLFLIYDGEWFFPLFRYLFFQRFYTKSLDLFYNLLMFTLPLFLLGWFFFKNKRPLVFFSALMIQIFGFLFILYSPLKDPAANSPSYARLNILLRYKLQKEHHVRLLPYISDPATDTSTLWSMNQQNRNGIVKAQKEIIASGKGDVGKAQERLSAMENEQKLLQNESDKISYLIMPLIRSFHWEEDAGGSSNLNRKAPWWELTRINRKDLIAALIFGTRVSLFVGLAATAISLLLAIPIGAFSGFYGSTTDIIVCRLMEIWESMPVFFMLLMVVAITQNKSIFLIILTLGIFGWTQLSRYIRGEFLKQRNLSYVEACRCLGFSDIYTMFRHILPNALPPVLTLLPFAIMGAITSEAGLSFLGLGEEGSTSWGVLMDEGRTVFPGESYLLWPPAILLTILLVAIAIVGDALRDAMDPKMRK